MKLIGTLVVLVLASVGISAHLLNSREQELSSITYVDDKADLDLVPGVPGEMLIFVDKKSISEEMVEGVLIRSASVVYHFKEPLVLNGQKIYYVSRLMGYHCESKIFAPAKTILYGKDSTELLFHSGPGAAELANDGSPAMAELEYVCKFKLKNKTPKSANPESDDPIGPESIDVKEFI